MKSALEHGNKEIENNPNIYNGHFITGEIYRQTAITQNSKEFFPKSIKLLEKAISIEGNSIEALVALGWIKRKQGYYEAAREFYLRARKLDESNPYIRKELGHIYRNIGQSKLAVEEFQTYLQLDPGASDRTQIEAFVRQLSR